MQSAVMALRRRHPAQIVVAVPVASNEAVLALEQLADRVVCLYEPRPFYAVGAHYADFAQVGDEDVRELLHAVEEERQRWTVA